MSEGSSRPGRGPGRARARRALVSAVGGLALLAGMLVVAPPAQAAASSDLRVSASTSSGTITVGTPALMYLNASTWGPDASGPSTITVSAAGAAATFAVPADLADDETGTTCAKVGATLRCTSAGFGDSRPWGTSFFVPVTATTAGALTLTVTIASAGSDPDSSNNTAVVALSAEIATASDVRVDVPWLDSAVRGGELRGEVTVATSGPHASGPVALHVEVSGAGGALTLPADYDDGRGTTCRATTTTLDCTVPTLSYTGRWGSDARIPIRVTPASTGSLTLTATATGTTPDPYPAYNTDTTTVEVVEGPAASLSLTAAADQEQQCSWADAFRGITVAGRLSSPSGDARYRTLVVTAVPDDGSATLTEETWTGEAGDFSRVLCGVATTGYTVTVRHLGSLQAGPASAVARVVPRASTITVVPPASSVVYGEEAVLVVTVRDALTSAVRDHADAVVERRAPGTTAWTVVAPVDDSVGADKVWRPSLSATATAEYRVRYPTQGIGALGVTSPPVLVTVRAKAGVAASPRIVTPGGRVTVTGTSVPGTGAAPVLERLARGVWTTVGVRPVRAAGKATWTLRLPSAGTTAYRVRVPGTAALAAGASATQTLTATLKGKGNPRAYSFVGGTRANPARWNPCQVIGYKVNTRYAKPGALADVQETMRRITQYSGLRFRYAGATSYLPGISRGAPPAPMVIAWATSRVDRSFRDPYLAGYATPSWYLTARPRIIRAGVMLNASMAMPPGFGTGFTRGMLLMHEIGHAVGLDHVNDPWSIMVPVNGPPGDAMFSAGDAVGLRKLGRAAGCLSSLELQDAGPLVTTTVR